MKVDNVREHPCPERSRRNRKAFMLIELLVALMVASFILTTVLTLAFAMTSAIDNSDDAIEKQAKVRYATLTISDLIKHCKLVCGTSSYDLAIWKSDDNSNRKIDITELVYIETNSNRNYIQLLDFLSVPKWLPTWLKNPDLSTIQSPWFKALLKLYCQKQYAVLVEQCSNAQFLLDKNPPNTEFVTISFNLQENGVDHQYQINASLRTQAAHLLDSYDRIVSDDD